MDFKSTSKADLEEKLIVIQVRNIYETDLEQNNIYTSIYININIT